MSTPTSSNSVPKKFYSNVEERTFVYVALDYDSQLQNFEFASRLSQIKAKNYGFKVNLDAVADFSNQAVLPCKYIEKLKTLGRPIFVDLKMWNGARTMSKIAEGCASLEVDIVNVYAHAGVDFISKVKDSIAATKTKLFCVTILTHYSDDDCELVYGCSLATAVKRLTAIVEKSGADGVILPATQLAEIRNSKLLKLCPGIRPSTFEEQNANFQKQILSPGIAIKQGANYLVLGSPIQKALDPVEALNAVLEEINIPMA